MNDGGNAILVFLLILVMAFMQWWDTKHGKERW